MENNSTEKIRLFRSLTVNKDDVIWHLLFMNKFIFFLVINRNFNDSLCCQKIDMVKKFDYSQPPYNVVDRILTGISFFMGGFG